MPISVEPVRKPLRSTNVVDFSDLGMQAEQAGVLILCPFAYLGRFKTPGIVGGITSLL
jgi:hypothetical protein